MKFCYLDESGIGDEKYAAMVGIIVDHTRMHKTKSEWKEQLDAITKLAGRRIDELHMNSFYPGNGPYRNIDGEIRYKIIESTFKWFASRKHTISISAIDKESFTKNEDLKNTFCNSCWCLMAYHNILQMQKNHQSLDKNKGNTILIFDEEVTEKDNLRALCNADIPLTDDYYCKVGKTPKQRMDQIVDYPYYADSRDVGLIQMADVITYIFRKLIEMMDGHQKEKYTGEKDKLYSLFQLLTPSFMPAGIILPTKGSEFAKLIMQVAPTSFRELINKLR